MGVVGELELTCKFSAAMLHHFLQCLQAELSEQALQCLQAELSEQALMLLLVLVSVRTRKDTLENNASAAC